ncbi:hypothetical protein CDEF62S_04467 [Castellaniella defragrans]
MLHDSLAELLGASDDGLMEYGYEDAVRLAGHSCPTVAGAWLMTVSALKALYPDGHPERGEIQVAFGEAADSGVTGVMANVTSLVTGATTDTGFHGLAGQHDRRNLLHFNADIAGEVAFTRNDTGASVAVSYSARGVRPHPTEGPGGTTPGGDGPPKTKTGNPPRPGRTPGAQSGNRRTSPGQQPGPGKRSPNRRNRAPAPPGEETPRKKSVRPGPTLSIRDVPLNGRAAARSIVPGRRTVPCPPLHPHGLLQRITVKGGPGPQQRTASAPELMLVSASNQRTDAGASPTAGAPAPGSRTKNPAPPAGAAGGGRGTAEGIIPPYRRRPPPPAARPFASFANFKLLVTRAKNPDRRLRFPPSPPPAAPNHEQVTDLETTAHLPMAPM